jgi:hypothetical protein
MARQPRRQEIRLRAREYQYQRTKNMALSIEDQNKITTFLASRHIPSGVGTKEEACSVAAINLALTGELTDRIPDCMSPVIGRWIIVVQDSMPDEMRNSAEWRALLPLAAGTGRDAGSEVRRMNIILRWMWETVLPHLQPVADKQGFGDLWRTMCEQRTAEAAEAAAEAAEAAWTAEAAAEAASAAAAAAAEAAWTAEAAAAEAASAAAAAAAWKIFDPVALLSQLVAQSA